MKFTITPRRPLCGETTLPGDKSLSPRTALWLYNIEPDLTTMGKVIGGGLPVGAYGGKRKIMQLVAPLGPIYQAGRLSGNPLATSAGIAELSLIREWESAQGNRQTVGNHRTQYPPLA